MPHLLILRYVFNRQDLKNAQSALVFIAVLYCTTVSDLIKLYWELGTGIQIWIKQRRSSGTQDNEGEKFLNEKLQYFKTNTHSNGIMYQMM